METGVCGGTTMVTVSFKIPHWGVVELMAMRKYWNVPVSIGLPVMKFS